MLSLSRFAGGVALLASLAQPVIAQQTPGWHSTLEASANVLFGTTSQTLSSIAAAVSHAGEGFTADGGFKFLYGESQDAQRVTFVSSRSWAATASLDILPKGRVSPFFFGSTEASLEKRIANRSAGGVGAKWVFAKSNTGAASISGAVLGERTTTLRDSAGAPAIAPVSTVRWSWRIKIDQRVHDRLSFSHVTFYAPAIDALANYTVTSTSVGSYAVNKAVALTLTFTDNYDSEARTRGAPTNNDGSLLFGVRGTF